MTTTRRRDVVAVCRELKVAEPAAREVVHVCMASAWRVVGLGLLLVAGCRARAAAVPAITERALNAELSYTVDPDSHGWRTFWARPGARDLDHSWHQRPSPRPRSSSACATCSRST